jgi:hypothetical protein
MKVRRFHQLQSELTGLDIFHRWTNSDKKPVGQTDISLIYKGREYEDTSVDFLAIGNTLIPCLTTENLIEVVRSMTPEQVSTLRTLLGF